MFWNERRNNLTAKDTLKVGGNFGHVGMIGSLLEDHAEQEPDLEGPDGEKCQTFAPIAGWARQTGENIIFVDDRDPFRHGFQVK